MGERTGISWTDHTFNPVWGCMEVSRACDFCYARTLDRRVGGNHWGPHAPFREFGDKHWAEPLRWDRAAEKDGVRRRVFCASMADVFDNRWPDHIRPRLWDLIWQTPHLDWLLLTKRPQNIAKMLPRSWGDVNGWANVWLGVTAEDQEQFHLRWRYLRTIPARVRYVSYEPALGPLSLPRAEQPDWIIAGGESGASHRAPDPQWFASLQRECEQEGIAFHFKQWGGRKPGANGCALNGREYKEFPRAA